MNSRLDEVQKGLSKDIEQISAPLSSILESLYSLNEHNNEINEESDETSLAKPLQKQADSNERTSYQGRFGIDGCKKQESIFFLKTSKTGSTTLSNILTRFGYARNKTFLFGEQSNGGIWFINSYLPFNENVCFLGKNIPDRPRIDISAVHIRYNKTAIDRVLQPNNRKISLLR